MKSMNREVLIEDTTRRIVEIGLSLDDRLTIRLEQRRLWGLLNPSFIKVDGRFIGSGADILGNSGFSVNSMPEGTVGYVVTREKQDIRFYEVFELGKKGDEFYGKVSTTLKFKPFHKEFSFLDEYLQEVGL
jgi:hypothetical protein